MTTILILLAYWFDYKQDKKRFLADLKGGSLFLIWLLIICIIVYFILNLGILYSVLAIGIAIPMMLFLKYLATK